MPAEPPSRCWGDGDCLCSKPYAAFTLTELLVTVAVIGILLSLLMPALATVRSAARSTACAANLRQYGMSIFLLRPTAPLAVNGLGHDAQPLFRSPTMGTVFREFRLPALGNASNRLLLGDRENRITTGSDLWDGTQVGERHRGRATTPLCDFHVETMDRATATVAIGHPELR